MVLAFVGDSTITRFCFTIKWGDYNIGIAIADLEEKASYDHYRSITQFKVYSNIHDVGLVRLGHKFIVDNKEIEGDNV